MTRIPSLKKIAARAVPWKLDFFEHRGTWYPLKSRRQATIPQDSKLLSKLGISRGDSILCIAGFFGNWASELATQQTSVDFNDASEEILDYVRAHLCFRDYLPGDYIYLPTEKMRYDWTFVFEPVGIRKGLPIAAMRSLLNRKGLKIVVYPKGLSGNDGAQVVARIRSILERMKTLYRARIEVKIVWIDATWIDGNPVAGPHVVCTLYTSRGARLMAERDLGALDRKQGSKASMRRLESIAKLLDPALTEDVRFESRSSGKTKSSHE